MGSVRQLRLVVTAAAYDAALRFYRDVLGMQQAEAVSSPGGRIAILDAGRATLEVVDEAHARYIDDVEVGRRVAGHIRVAFEVDDAQATTQRLAEGGAAVVKEPTLTPWNSLNARLDTPGELHITVFQEPS